MNTHPNDSIAIGMSHATTLGSIWAAVGPRGLVAISFGDDEGAFRAQVERLTELPVVTDSSRVQSVLMQIETYLRGESASFDMPIDWSVLTAFQQEALRVALAIPYGQTRTYGDLAETLGKPGAARAVGRAMATNPMPIVLPCHRVVGSNGDLHGFSGPDGIKTKAWLLQLEGKVTPQQLMFDFATLA